MPVEYVLLILATVLLLGFALFQCVIGAGLWWVLRQALPVHDLTARLSSMEMDVSSLSAQVTKLRTSKAGNASKARKQELQQQEADDELSGLDPQTKALFQGVPYFDNEPS